MMTPGLRKFALTVHISASVGWLGAVVAYLALAVVTRTSQDAQMVRAAYLSLEPITGYVVLVPLAFTSLLTGLVMSLGTPWGLFRHYWVVFQTPVNRLCHHRLAGVHSDNEPHVRRSIRSYNVHCRSPRDGGRHGTRRWRPGGVARDHDTVGVQTAGHNTVRVA
jgi:hypothetical protein